MPHRYLRRVVLVAILCLVLATPARASNLQTNATLVIVGIVAVSAAIAVLVTVLVLHHKDRKSEITGCVSAGANGMGLTDETDKRTYTLSGGTAAVKAGDRVTLEGKRRKAKGNTLVFEVRRLNMDFGACHR